MIFLILSILCSTSIVLLLKYNREQRGSTTCLLSGNYLAASFLSLLILSQSPNHTFSFVSFIFGAFVSFIFVFSFFMFSKAVTVAGSALAALSSRVSLVIPVGLSVFFFKESPDMPQTAGFLLSLVTILLFSLSLKTESKSNVSAAAVLIMFILLVSIGTGDFMMKVFSELRPPSEKPLFLASIFSWAFIITAVFRLLSGRAVDKRSFLRGLVLGVPNFFSSFFLLSALKKLNASFVYPAVSISVIILTAFASNILWNEKINTYGKISIVIGGIAIIFLI